MHALLFDSITDVSEVARGRVIVSGSHGGLYPAMLASRVGPRAVIFNDAGPGLDEAGVLGVHHLALVGLAAAACGAQSCRIGDAADMMSRGRLSVVNRVAEAAGVRLGMEMETALRLIDRAHAPHGVLPPMAESRKTARLDSGVEVLLVDSASLIEPGDAGRLIVTGRHGALIGGDPARACKAQPFAVVFNDRAGNDERSAYLYDTRRVALGPKIGEVAIVDSDRRHVQLPGIQRTFKGFNRNPYLASLFG